MSMKTVDKALKLMRFFTIPKPERGLSEIAREADLDKATALRLLTSLVHHAFLSQDNETKKYRLGHAVLNLARIREASFPVTTIIQPVLERLAETTGETTHASLAAAEQLVTIGIAEPRRATRVHMDYSEILPFHATASGIAYMAFAGDAARREIRPSFARFTEHTTTNAAELDARVNEAAQNGYAVSTRSFEFEVTGIAAPIFGWSGHATGAIAAASLAARTDQRHERMIAGEVLNAAVEVTRAMGAEPHQALLRACTEIAA